MDELSLDNVSSAPGVAFASPDPVWQHRFPGPAMRVLLLLLETALDAGSYELLVLTVREHHASVCIVPDREPVEIAQIGLTYYDGMRDFVRHGLFEHSSKPLIQWHSKTYGLTLAQIDQTNGEGFGLSIALHLLAPY